MAISKVVYGASTLVDLTGDTVTVDDVAEGVTFHGADGVKRSGTRSSAPAAHASTHATGGSDPITPANIGAASSSHTHTPASIGAMGIGEANGAVGDMYTISIEPDVGSAGYSSIKIKETATGNKQVLIGTQKGFRDVISSFVKLCEGENSPFAELLHTSSGYNGLDIYDDNSQARLSLYYDAPSDSCGFEILDASGNDVTLQTIGAQPKRMSFTDVSVPDSAWVDDSYDQYTDFPYQAQVECAGVTSDMFAEVVLNPSEQSAAIMRLSALRVQELCGYMQRPFRPLP